MEQQRKKLQGASNILSFNRHFYVIGLAALALLFITQWFAEWPHFLFWGIVSAFVYGLVMPLIVSAYVYDFSGYYQFPWLNGLIAGQDRINLIVSINAGFDETSFIIKEKFPQSDLEVFDFYNAERHTEPAIKRARKVSLTYPNTRKIASDSIPIEDSSADIVFLLSAVHEIRSQAEKVLFLKECHRLCKQDGKVIMVEHLRDFPNFLAFSVGFTHFFSRSAWRRALQEAGFSRFRETKFTPFMSVFDCSP